MEQHDERFEVRIFCYFVSLKNYDQNDFTDFFQVNENINLGDLPQGNYNFLEASGIALWVILGILVLAAILSCCLRKFSFFNLTEKKL